MSFFQNPFTADFYGVLSLGDRQHSVDFKCPRNAGRGDEYVTAWKEPTYDMSGTDADGVNTNVLTLAIALNDRKNWSLLSVTISGATSSAVTAEEVVADLQSDTRFTEYFVASISDKFADGKSRIVIRQRLSVTKFWFYVVKGAAETVLGFNDRAGVAELPTYFARHTVANRFTYTDCQNHLIALEPATLDVDAAIIDNATDERGVNLGFSSGTVKEDWQLLRGRSGIFILRKQTVDGSNRITQIIEYPAGALAGDLGKKIKYTYTGANTSATTVSEIPYTLQLADLITP